MNSKELARRAVERATNPVDKIEIMARHDLPGIAALLEDYRDMCWFELVPENYQCAALYQTNNRDDRLYLVMRAGKKQVRLHFARLAQHLSWDQDACTAFVDQMLERLEGATAPEVEDDLSWSRGLMEAVRRYCDGADSPYWPLVAYKAVRQVMLEPSHQVFRALDLTAEDRQDRVKPQAMLLPVRMFLEKANVEHKYIDEIFIDAIGLPDRTMIELVALVGALGSTWFTTGALVEALNGHLLPVLREQFKQDEVHRTNHFAYLLTAGLACENSAQVGMDVRIAFLELMAAGGEPIAWQYACLFGKELHFGMRSADEAADLFIASCRTEAIGRAAVDERYGIAAALALGAGSDRAWELVELAIAHGQRIGFTNGHVMTPKGWRAE